MSGASQRHTVAAPDESLRRPEPSESAMPDKAIAGISNRAMSSGASGAPLDPQIRRQMEARFGESFAAVRVHDDPDAHRAAADLDSKAFTVGQDIRFSEDRYAPHTTEGKRLLAHELAHVVQQRRGGDAPALDPDASHEVAADRAASAVVQGSATVQVAGATGIGVAREPEDEKKKKNSKKKKRPEERSSTPPVRTPSPRAKPKASVTKITEPNKATGVLGEVTTPFDVYSDPSWNNLAGGEETSSSRMSVARETKWGKTAGLDNLVENRKTGRLVIGEQKRLGSSSFDDATAITENLEKNLDNAAQKLREGIKSGRVHPEEIKNVEDVISRLEQTSRALRERSSLPEEVVFELTNVGGKSTKIGKGYIDLLAKKYGDNPEFISKLLDRTFIRDPKLAKAMGRDPAGVVGTNTDPHIVPAKQAMTDAARSELDRLLAGKTPKEWEKMKRKEKQQREQEKKRAREEERKAKQAEREKIKAEAKRIGEEARKKALEELREAAKRKGESQPKSKAEQRAAENKLKAQAKEKGKAAEKKALQDARERAKQPKLDKQTTKDTAKTKAPAESAKQPTAESPAPKEPVASAPKEPVKPPIETPKSTVSPEIAPKEITAKGVAKGALGVAGGLAAISGAKDIVKELKEGHYGTAAAKTGLLGLSFLGEAAPPLFAFGAIMNYWGPRHEGIEKDSFAVGSVVEDAAGHIPLLGRSETARRVMGGIAAAGTAVGESVAYTVKDMAVAVADGAETVVDVVEDGADFVGGALEDAWDWATDW